MVIDLHPAIAVLALLAVVWFLYRATRPCKCCTHRANYHPEDFT